MSNPKLDWEAISNEINSSLNRQAITREFSIGQLTTYRTEANCRLFLTVKDQEELSVVATLVRERSIKVAIIGNGSNLLIADRGFNGIVMKLGTKFESFEIQDNIVTAGAAAKLPVIARQTAVAGLSGFEWAVGVPGTIGGGVKMNAGGHGSDMKASVQGAEIVDLSAGEKYSLSSTELAFGYRVSSVNPTQVVTEVELALEEGTKSDSEEIIREIVKWRLDNQPGGQNAGSVFRNPENDSAGRLIEETGSKGYRIGTAQVSEKHANFIQVDPGGKANDVYALMQELRRRVLVESGVLLEVETELIGFE